MMIRTPAGFTSTVFCVPHGNEFVMPQVGGSGKPDTYQLDRPGQEMSVTREFAAAKAVSTMTVTKPVSLAELTRLLELNMEGVRCVGMHLNSADLNAAIKKGAIAYVLEGLSSTELIDPKLAADIEEQTRTVISAAHARSFHLLMHDPRLSQNCLPNIVHAAGNLLPHNFLRFAYGVKDDAVLFTLISHDIVKFERLNDGHKPDELRQAIEATVTYMLDMQGTCDPSFSYAMRVRMLMTELRKKLKA